MRVGQGTGPGPGGNGAGWGPLLDPLKVGAVVHGDQAWIGGRGEVRDEDGLLGSCIYEGEELELQNDRMGLEPVNQVFRVRSL